MLILSRWKLISIISVCIFGIIFSFPNLLSDSCTQKLPSWLKNKVNLGLELQGGSYLQYSVDPKAITCEYLTNLVNEVRQHLRKERILYQGLKINDSKETGSYLEILLKQEETADKVKTILKKIDPDLLITAENNKILISISKDLEEKRLKNIIEQSMEVIRKRIDESGTKEPFIQRQGLNRISIQLPGVHNPSEVKNLVGKTAKMSFKAVDSRAFPINHPNERSAPLGSDYIPLKSIHETVYIPVKKEVIVSGETLVDAQATFGADGQPIVNLRFNALGGKKFGEMSRQYLGKQFAIVLDDVVISAPVFRDVIPSGDGQISGNFTVKEAQELALLLRAGALPAPLKVVEERTVGPTLGQDSIKEGQKATILSFILVSVFMILTYSTFGFFANIALVFNIILLFAGLSLLQATLTLPGIAGIALTIGMAVDANVLIYERIKEDIRAGIHPIRAISTGYKRAMTTILDSNITTLLGAAALFEFGSGSIRGFAVTLSLGILISLFTALSLTRLIISLWVKRKRKITALPI